MIVLSRALFGKFCWNQFLQGSANFGSTTSAWFGNQAVKIDDANVVLGGTFLLLPILSASDVLLGYIRATGSNLTEANLDKTGVITSVVHEDTSNNAVPGDVISSGVTPATFQYGGRIAVTINSDIGRMLRASPAPQSAVVLQRSGRQTALTGWSV